MTLQPDIPAPKLAADSDELLAVEKLRVSFALDEGTVRAVQDVSLRVRQREIVGVIGESGCGKSVTAQAIMRILPKPGRIDGGRMLFHSRRHPGELLDLAALPANSRAARQIRGAEICMIFQEPMTAFSPVHTIGSQIVEAIRLHRKMTSRAARSLAAEMLERVGIPQGRARLDAYPFQLSGGMRQRAMIAMALCTHPSLLIADEPSTALDVTIQAQILDLMKELRDAFDMAILLITHDLGVVAETCQYVYVMYLGRVVESGTVDQIFHHPHHPYTRALLGSMPRLTGPVEDRLTVIQGSVPDPYATLSGCPFHPRCTEMMPGKCDQGEAPDLTAVEADHHAACLLHTESSQ